MNDALKTCPSCNGAKEIFAFVNTGPDITQHRSGMNPCFTCKGVGRITGSHHSAIEAGKILRATRIRNDEAIAVAAERLGMTSIQYIALENGRILSNDHQ